MVTVKPLTVHWHQESAPIYSACFQPREIPPANRSARLVTAGGDNNVRVWRLKLGPNDNESPQVEYLATLAKHERAVNVVRFNSLGTILASAGDDGVVCLWTLQNTADQPITKFGNDFEDLENWRLLRKCRSASFGEIYDLSWSPSGQFLAAASMDNVVSILDTTDGSCIAALRDHKLYVQGVTWDPLNEFLATQSSDQTVLIYQIKEIVKGTSKTLHFGSPIIKLDKSRLNEYGTSFHSEAFSSFFRRLSFSSEGSVLITPAGLVQTRRDVAEDKIKSVGGKGSKNVFGNDDKMEETMIEENYHDDIQQVTSEVYLQGTNIQRRPSSSPPPSQGSPLQYTSSQSTSYLHCGVLSSPPTTLEPKLDDSPSTSSSSSIQPPPNITSESTSKQNCAFVFSRSNLGQPQAVLPLPKESLAIQFSPQLFKLKGSNPAIKLPYRMIYAIVTTNGVFIYDTEQLNPLGMASNLHYSSLTDLAWSPDGKLLILTSIDGFCSVFRFSSGDLGEVYTDLVPALAKLNTQELRNREDQLKMELEKAETPKMNILFARRKSKTESNENKASKVSQNSGSHILDVSESAEFERTGTTNKKLATSDKSASSFAKDISSSNLNNAINSVKTTEYQNTDFTSTSNAENKFGFISTTSTSNSDVSTINTS